MSVMADSDTTLISEIKIQENKSDQMCKLCHDSGFMKCHNMGRGYFGTEYPERPICSEVTICPDCQPKKFSCEKCKYNCNHKDMEKWNESYGFNTTFLDIYRSRLNMIKTPCCTSLSECDCVKKYASEMQNQIDTIIDKSEDFFTDMISEKITSLEIPSDHGDSVKKVLSMIFTIHQSPHKPVYNFNYESIIKHMIANKF